VKSVANHPNSRAFKEIPFLLWLRSAAADSNTKVQVFGPDTARISTGAEEDAKNGAKFTRLPQDFLFPFLRTIARSTTFTMPKRTSARRGPFHKCKTAKMKRRPRRCLARELSMGRLVISRAE
jgi:hypothetical protein